jgi:hypothetical protein
VYYLYYNSGLGYLSLYIDLLQAIRSRYRIPVGARFLHLARPALWPTQPAVQWVLDVSRAYSGQGLALTTHPYRAPRLYEEDSYTSTPHLGIFGLF